MDNVALGEWCTVASIALLGINQIILFIGLYRVTERMIREDDSKCLNCISIRRKREKNESDVCRKN
ncbi:MAG: hypothetical protein R3Y58_07355 [Eubacteriales bacterium]